MSNTDNQSVKAEIINNVIVAMTYYLSSDVLEMLDILKDVAKRAGVTSRVYPHKMRKTLGMELKNKGVDIGTIQEIMGHADSRVTSLYYAQSTPDTLRVVRNKAA